MYHITDQWWWNVVGFMMIGVTIFTAIKGYFKILKEERMAEDHDYLH